MAGTSTEEAILFSRSADVDKPGACGACVGGTVDFFTSTFHDLTRSLIKDRLACFQNRLRERIEGNKEVKLISSGPVHLVPALAIWQDARKLCRVIDGSSGRTMIKS